MDMGPTVKKETARVLLNECFLPITMRRVYEKRIMSGCYYFEVLIDLHSADRSTDNNQSAQRREEKTKSSTMVLTPDTICLRSGLYRSALTITRLRSDMGAIVEGFIF
jgi:hypothetical protein